MVKKKPLVRLEEKKLLSYEQVMKSIETIFTEPVVGLTNLLKGRGCAYRPLLPANPKITKAYYADVSQKERPCEYYVVEDARGLQICTLEIVPGDEIIRRHYWGKFEYVGPPEEKELWQEFMEEIRRLRVD